MQPRTRSGLWGFCVAVGLSTVVAAQQPAARPMALVGGTLIDGSGGPPMRDSVVLVRGGRIERVGTVDTLPVPSGYERISTEGMTVLPGLWDLHVHLIYNGHPNVGVWFKHSADFERVTIPASARQMLMAGVTSVRDMAAPPQAILGVKKRIASGELPGPTLYTAGPALAKLAPGQTTTTPQFLPIADAADARAKARQLLDQGVDLIKMFFVDRMSADERTAIIERGPRARAKARDARPERRRRAARAVARHRRLPAHRHRQPGIRAGHHGGACARARRPGRRCIGRRQSAPTTC